MTWGLVAVAGATVVGGYMASSSASDAASSAAQAQGQASDKSIAESQRQFDAIQKLLAPYTAAGPQALTGQQDLLGLNGSGAQGSAIAGIANGPQMQAMTQQGENSILQNASATGGLRGGNTQGALAQFRPQLLNQLIQQQYGNLGGLTSIGQNCRWRRQCRAEFLQPDHQCASTTRCRTSRFSLGSGPSSVKHVE
jgi:hypothetical protein